MPGTWLAAGAVVMLALVAIVAARTDLLLRIAGADPAHILTVPDRVRYSSMGAIVCLTAAAAAASLTLALSLVFPQHSWPDYLPVGLLWGTIVFNFDRWIVSSLDYGPLTGETPASGQPPTAAVRRGPRIVHFGVRFVMSALVGLVISEPIVLAVFGPEISQQLTAQHTTDIAAQTAQIQAAAARQAAALSAPVTSARTALRAATRHANAAHKIYICELTGNCHLPPGEVTGVPGVGPQTLQDQRAWQQAVAQQRRDQRILNAASATERAQAAALATQTRQKTAKAAQTINADNGLLARERALDTLSRRNPGFLLRRLMLWLALMFIDLAPVLLKTFSPPTLYEHLQRSAAVRLGRNALADAAADSDHHSAKKAVTREHDLAYHRTISGLTYGHTIAGPGFARTATVSGSAHPIAGPGFARTATGTGAVVTAAGTGAAPPAAAARGGTVSRGWVIGGRWHVQRPLPGAEDSGRVPFVATDLRGEYPFEVVVKIIAPPPHVPGWEAARERRHAQMEMSLPQGHIHGNLAEVLDRDVDPRHGYYLVTRRYPATLERYLARASEEDSLNLGRVLGIGGQVLAGLVAAWDRGLVHLDLKPANVALTEDGTVKLIDFGLAQRYQEVNGGNGTTSVARFTMFYAPPEQMERRDTSWISREADLRALGAVIYRMVTGYPPMYREARALGLLDAAGHWQGSEAAAYLDMIDLVRGEEPVSAATLIPYLPAELDVLLSTWLRADPRGRSPGNPATMAERVWLEASAVFGRLRVSGEAGYPVGLRVTQEPDFADLRERWRSRPGGRATPGTGPLAPPAGSRGGAAADPTTAGLGSVATLEEALPGPPRAHGFVDPSTVVP